jgi:endonuclease YncB( thermonuclease family)
LDCANTASLLLADDSQAMPWLNFWPFGRKAEQEDQLVASKASAAVDNVLQQAKDVTAPRPTAFSQIETWLAAGGLTFLALTGFRFYRSYLRRIPQATDIRPAFLRKRSVFGRVTSVGDGDNFRLYHTPGGMLTGWGWLPWRRVPSERKALKDQTIHVRLAGIDAPELPHFGRPEQPYAKEAFQWLTDYLGTRRVRAYVYKQDQYSRVVATVYVRKGLFRRDVGLQMLRAGMATVYEANTGAEFGEFEDKYRKAEQLAKTRRKGLWAGKNNADFETPGAYKKRHGSGSPIDGTV